MPYTYPTSRAAGYVVQAADWNAEIVSNGQWIGKDKPACLAVHTATQSIANNTLTALTFTGTEAYDTQSQHDTATNPSRITITGAAQEGLYHIHANGMFAANATGQRYVQIRLSNTYELYRVSNDTPNATYPWSWEINGYYRLTAGSYIEVHAYQNSGGALNIDGATLNTKFGAVWVAA